MGNDFYVDFANILGTGDYGQVVYGTWKGNGVAVKQIPLVKRQTEDVIRSLDHPNVVKLLHVERPAISDTRRDFSYWALELCPASLDQLVRGPMPSRKNIFLGLAQGMEYIHSRNLIYDGVKPKSVLILVDSKDRRNSKAKWSSSRLLSGGGGRTESRETAHLSDEEAIWKAPELMTDQFEKPETIASNTFAVGLVFAYVLLHGDEEHLYKSDDGQILNNIKSNKPVNIHSKYYII